MNDKRERSCDIHNLIWRSPDGRKVNQIDHVLMNGNMKRSILDTRVMRGANVYSDHYLVKNKGWQEEECKRGVHISKLQSEEIRWRYNIDLRNRFEALGDRGSGARTIMILSTYSKPWIGNKPWEKIKERKEAKLKIEGKRSKWLKQMEREV